MKLSRMVVVVVCMFFALLMTGCDQGGLFNGNEHKPDVGYQLSAPGWDLRVYEFTPLTGPGMTCVFTAGKGKGGLDCFPKVMSISVKPEDNLQSVQ